ncbi:MAG: wax ester/triacylglycerol synthase family O-acyltransferase [Actinomycetota bacterium]|nr:wax ester/triacylglycerol synthase family O-acyltransferase [Actinomycetota bacterium]
MARKRLNLIDRAWLLGHRHDMPLHVAGLAVFASPADASDDFVRNMMADFWATRTFARPFNHRLRQTRFPTLNPAWEVLGDEQIDIEYHVRHTVVARPGGERELGMLVSRLHSHPHDLTRPLWELHVIDGLADGRFAMYLKVHHSLIDGVGLMRRLTRMVTNDPNDHDRAPVWAIGTHSGEPTPRRTKPRATLGSRIADGIRLGAGLVKAAAGIAGEAVRPSNPDAATLFGAPRSVLNQPISPQRRLSTQSFELERIKQVAKAADVTVNDVLLAISSTALRRHLTERGQLPATSLTAAAPVSMRHADDTTSGNAFSLLLVTLHTALAHPLERITAIAESSRLAKAALTTLPRPVADNFGVLVFAPFILELVLRLAGRTRPPCTLIISNVPGPSGPLYFNGAHLQGLYPFSLVFDGIALSITALSAGDRFNLGIVGCPDALPHLQRFATYHRDALAELEHTLNLP